MATFKLGKHQPTFDTRTLLFGKYLTKELPAPPASKDYSRAVTTWPIMGNDAYGDCTCAAAGHMIEEWTANHGTQKVLPDAHILAAYKHFAGNNPDAAANMLDLLKYCRKHGIVGHQPNTLVQLQPHHDHHPKT